ncbi:energy transducer TonB [Pleurocapsa sp. FMAR1]|uniref:energy transducer TonB n=1 Tax=Pleurocapsa sp. FMAR1 TaxID=3040204 RepID=UPI0029C66262|nr:energy transducer TonB [Pleurocapsa sp. FMAR1]
MVYESKLDNQFSKLINPAQLCLIISLALHLLVLKFGLPSLKFNNDSGERKVAVIELSPEQQARLPNLSPELNTPNTPNINNLPPIDNSEPAAPFAIPRSLFPGLGDPSNLPPVAIPPPPNFDNLPPLPPITDITLPPVGDLSKLPLPPEIEPGDFKVDPSKVSSATKPTKKPGQPSKPENAQQQAQKSPQTAAKPEPKPQVEPKPTPEKVAAKKVDNSQKRIANLTQSLTKNEEGTTDEDARKNYIAWLAKVKEIKPDEIEATGTYPRDACIRRLKGTSVFGVVVNAKGEVVDLDLIKGAKYPIFNKQGVEDVAQLVLENKTKKPKPYQVTLNYEYDPEICPSLTLPSIRTEESQKAAPTPAPAPKPKPEPKPAPTPAPAPAPTPSLKDQLRNIKLPSRKPSDLKDTPLPEQPKLEP